MISFRPLRFPFLILVLALLSGLFTPAGAAWVGRYFLFDRAVWSPDGQSVAVIGHYTNVQTGETLEDTILVDAATAQYRCLSPSVLNMVVSPDRSRILFGGRWGLYDYEVASGRTRLVQTIDPFNSREVQLFSYNRTMDAAIVVRCAEDYPESSGVYEYPLAGGAARLLLPDEACGPQSLNYWQSHRRDISPMEYNLPRLEKPTTVKNFPGTIWQLRIAGAPATAIWGNGSAPAETLCAGCRPEFNSWPTGGGLVLISTAPEDLKDVTTPGDLWLVRPSLPAVHLARGRFEKVVWADSSLAYVLARPGRLYRVDIPDETVTPVEVSLVPDWLRQAPLAPARVWTLAVESEVFAHPDSARARALKLREFGLKGYGVEPIGEAAGYRLLVGSFADSAEAAAAVPKLLRQKAAGLSGSLSVRSRPVSAMLGNFDFGSLVSPDGKRRIYFRSHPHLFQPHMASEVWVQKLPEDRPKLAIRAMANF